MWSDSPLSPWLWLILLLGCLLPGRLLMVERLQVTVRKDVGALAKYPQYLEQIRGDGDAPPCSQPWTVRSDTPAACASAVWVSSACSRNSFSP
jgi:hypothetical protein